MSLRNKPSVTKQRNDGLTLLIYANQKRTEEMFNDVTITVNGKCFPANRLVLSCYSKFFETMFQTEMRERYQNTIEINQIDEKSMQIVVEFIYTGTITIDEENVVNLLSAADYLLMDSLKQYCFKFLESNIDHENCLSVFNVSILYSNETLQTKVYEQLNDCFEDAATTLEFKQLSKLNLISCILNLNRNTIEEELIYKAIITWTNYDLEARRSEFAELFELIVISRLSLDFMINIALSESLIGQNEPCMNHLKSELSTKVTSIQKENSRVRILSIGGTYKFSKVCIVYSSFPAFPRNYPDLPIKVQNHCLLVSDNIIYVIGGKNPDPDEKTYGYSDQVWELDLNLASLNWKKLSSLRSTKAVMGATVYQNVLTIAGGISSTSILSSTEIYFKALDEWKEISPLNEARYANELVTCDDGVFCLGGHDGKNVLSSVEHLVDLKSKWKFVKPMLTPRKWFAAVNCKGTIYAIGGKANDDGDDKESTLKSVERYYPGVDTWIYVSGMNIARASHSACVLQDKIYVIGGLDKDRNAVKEIECYDSALNKWSIIDKTCYKLFNHKTVLV